jgi:hypothetical protein
LYMDADKSLGEIDHTLHRTTMAASALPRQPWE